MGTSTDAILCFGFPLGDEEHDEHPLPPWREEDEDGETGYEDFDDWVARVSGIGKRPPGKHSEDDTVQSWYDRRRAAVEACPVEEIWHCSGSYPMYILAIRGTEVTASRGYPKTISPESLAVPPARIEEARAFCERGGVQWQEPQWLLCSYLSS